MIDEKSYSDRLRDYGVRFCSRLYFDSQCIAKIGDVFGQSGRAKDFCKSIEDLGLDVVDGFISMGLEPTPTIIDGVYAANPHFKLNMMFAMAMTKLLYGNDYDTRVLNLLEIISLRSLCVHLSINDSCSVQSRMITALGIPVAEVPLEIVKMSRTLDEYIKAVNLIEAEVKKVDEPDAYPALSMYRDHVREHAARIIHYVNSEGFYGTYPEYVFVEMIMLRKLCPDQYPSLYGTPALPRWEIAYDELKEVVLNAWRIRNGGSDNGSGDAGSGAGADTPNPGTDRS